MDALQLQLAPLIRLATVILTVAMLYWARELFIPLALAGLFAFLLNPVVSGLKHKLGLPRPFGVMVVAGLAFAFLGVVVWLVGGEMHNLAKEIPAYRTNIHERIESVKSVGEGGIVGNLQKLAGELDSRTAPDLRQPIVVENSANRLQEYLLSAVGHVADSLGTATVVIVFVIFILIRLQDLRNRFIRVVGFSRLTTTTRALDEAATRISRYLLMQTLINSFYGLLLGVGFWIIGLPYVFLWGVLAALFRFVPYIGPWIAAVLPLAVSLAVFDGWTVPLLVLSVIVGLELLTNLVVEPHLYGQSAGVSDLALLVAIAFWTWMWGPVGLLLATPLTVCLVVFCKYIPELSFIEVLMGDKPVVQQALVLYQRLLVGDIEEAEQVVEAAAQEADGAIVVDEVLLPAAVHARREMLAGRLTEEEAQKILKTLSELSEQVREAQEEKRERNDDEALPVLASGEKSPLILCRSFDESSDRIALSWLTAQWTPTQLRWGSIADAALVSEVIEQIKESEPAVVILSAMPPGASGASRVLCKRLRHHFPNLRILLARWGAVHTETAQETGASWVVTTTQEAAEKIGTALRLNVKASPSSVREDRELNAPEAETSRLVTGAAS